MTKSFSCDECELRTTNKMELKAHINKKHIKLKSLSSDKSERLITYIGTSPQPAKDSSELLMIKDSTLDQTVLEEVSDNVDTTEDEPVDTIEGETNELSTDFSSKEGVEIEDSTFYCSICAKSFEEYDCVVKHSQDEHGVELGYTCNSCGKSFVNQDNLRKHDIADHAQLVKKQEDFHCINCNKVIRTVTGIERHFEIYCEKCKK